MEPAHEKLILAVLRSFLWFRITLVAIAVLSGYGWYAFGEKDCDQSDDRTMVSPGHAPDGSGR